MRIGEITTWISNETPFLPENEPPAAFIFLVKPLRFVQGVLLFTTRLLRKRLFSKVLHLVERRVEKINRQ